MRTQPAVGTYFGTYLPTLNLIQRCLKQLQLTNDYLEKFTKKNNYINKTYMSKVHTHIII